MGKVVVISSFTIDEIDGEVFIGGPAYYSSLALAHLGESVVVVSPAENVHEEFMNYLGFKLITVNGLTPIFNLRYVDGGRREVRLKRKGAVIELSPKVLNLLRDSLTIVNPVYRELSIDTLRVIRKHSGIIALDVQGFIRKVNSGEVVKIAWSDIIYELLSIADIVHADLSEIPTYSSMREACKALSKFSKSIVIVSSGEKGLVASVNGELYYIPALPGIEGNATGTGDILLAISSYEIMRGEDPLRAIAKGAVAAGLRVSRDRLPWFTRSEIEVLSIKLLSRATKV